MADYWKSLPRKFCEFCKCWITDNKPSIEFHERGRRHQENVQKKLGELRKKGKKDFDAKRKMDKELQKMNEAALNALKQDIARDPSLARELQNHVPSACPEPTGSSQEVKLPKPPKPPKPKRASKEEGTIDREKCIKSWLEAQTESGQRYYFNVESGASIWSPPEEGYVSIAEQRRQQNISEPGCMAAGPSPKTDPYGQWTVVSNDSVGVDLQLPEKEFKEYKIVPADSSEKFKFKEKTVGSIAKKHTSRNPEEVVAFKKRKNTISRNVRRTAEDD